MLAVRSSYHDHDHDLGKGGRYSLASIVHRWKSSDLGWSMPRQVACWLHHRNESPAPCLHGILNPCLHFPLFSPIFWRQRRLWTVTDDHGRKPYRNLIRCKSRRKVISSRIMGSCVKQEAWGSTPPASTNLCNYLKRSGLQIRRTRVWPDCDRIAPEKRPGV